MKLQQLPPHPVATGCLRETLQQEGLSSLPGLPRGACCPTPALILPVSSAPQKSGWAAPYFTSQGLSLPPSVPKAVACTLFSRKPHLGQMVMFMEHGEKALTCLAWQREASPKLNQSSSLAGRLSGISRHSWQPGQVIPAAPDLPRSSPAPPGDAKTWWDAQDEGLPWSASPAWMPTSKRKQK